MISIFKTNIEKKIQVEKISKELDELIGNSKWSFDLEDCDRILRVETQNCISKLVIEKLVAIGFECEEIL